MRAVTYWFCVTNDKFHFSRVPGGLWSFFYKLQADYIAQKSKEKSVPVIAFVEDMAASGGYWLATAAPTIYVSQSSLVGSIGVISQGFGFHETIAKLGK